MPMHWAIRKEYVRRKIYCLWVEYKKNYVSNKDKKNF